MFPERFSLVAYVRKAFKCKFLRDGVRHLQSEVIFAPEAIWRLSPGAIRFDARTISLKREGDALIHFAIHMSMGLQKREFFVNRIIQTGCSVFYFFLFYCYTKIYHPASHYNNQLKLILDPQNVLNLNFKYLNSEMNLNSVKNFLNLRKSISECQNLIISFLKFR